MTTDPDIEFVDDTVVNPEVDKMDAAIAEVARLLQPEERERFMAAIQKVTKEASRGKVRLREPTKEEQLILDAFQRYNYKAKDTAEALGIDLDKVYTVTRRWNARPVESTIPALRNPSEHLLRFLRSMWAEGKTMREMAEAVREITGLENVPGHYQMKSLCDKAGIDTTRPKFDIRRYPELIEAFDALAVQFDGFSVGTLFRHYERAKKAAKGLPK